MRTSRLNRLGRLAASGCLLALLGACGEPGTDTTPQAVEIVFKHSKLFGDPAPFKALVQQFEERNPDIRVKAETLPSSSDEQHQFYVINLRAGSASFDVFAMDVIWVAEFAKVGWLRDVSHLIPSEERSEFFAGTIEAVTYQGKVYAVPWFIDAGLLYYRKDLLDKHGFEPPETWPELVEAAGRVAAKEDIYGFVWQGKQYEGLVCNVLEFLWSNRGRVLQDGQVVLDSPENREALRFMTDLIHRHRVTPALVNTATEEPSRRIFGDGKAVFLRNWPYAWNLFQRQGSLVKDKVGVRALPRFEGGESAAALGGWQLGVNPYSEHPEAAERFVSFLASPESQKALALAYGFNPTREGLYRDPEILRAQPFLRDLYSVFRRAVPRPVSPYYVQISQVLQAQFSAAVAGVTEPEAALRRAQEQIEAILQP